MFYKAKMCVCVCMFIFFLFLAKNKAKEKYIPSVINVLFCFDLQGICNHVTYVPLRFCT